MTADPFLHAADIAATGIPAAELANILDEPDDDPHAGCWQPQRGPNGDYHDCDGQPI